MGQSVRIGNFDNISHRKFKKNEFSLLNFRCEGNLNVDDSEIHFIFRL